MTVHETFGHFVSQLAPVPPVELAWLLTQTQVVVLEPDELFVSAGEVSTYFGFVVSGALHSYCVDDGGRRFTQAFLGEGDFAGSYASLLLSEPSTLTLQALVRCELAVVPYAVVKQLYDRHPAWDRVGRRVAESEYLKRVERERALLCLRPADRYLRLCAERPRLVKRLPQYLIASYLGISPVSLSRIRARLRAEDAL